MRYSGVALLAIVSGSAWGQDAPDAAKQQQVLHSVTEFARTYLNRLPDFTCVRTTEHWLAWPGTKKLLFQVKVANELSYYRRQEHYRLIAVDDVPKKRIPSDITDAGWIESSGFFGSVISDLFDPKIRANFEWKGYEDIRGKRAYVFSYHVPLASSRSASLKCTAWTSFNTCRNLKYAYHGLLYVDAESLDIQRLTHVPEGLPANYSTGAESVDYGRVTVAGLEYLLPIADRQETASGKTLFRNDSTYGSYRKFVAESSLKDP
jgi:hypothetical protein